MRNILLATITVLLLAISCSSTFPFKKEKTYYVLIETKYGNMKVKLYNETPLHRDNFIKLVKEGFYDSLLFHRVIKDFMIQGGDPDSKNAPAGKQLGMGDPGYKIDAEIVTGLYHKKGALAAAREGDRVNPEKKSSGSQFYIVQGKPVTEKQLEQMQEHINAPKKQKIFNEYITNPENADKRQLLDSLSRAGDRAGLNTEIEQILKTLEPEFEKQNLFKYSDEQIQTYTTIGGTPHLDGNYTVFGEVIEGLNIIDSIANVKTDRNNRPLDDIIMKMKVVRK